MARIRTIKPEFFKNEQLSDLPAITRLLFIGLWTQADKEGRLLDRPKRLKAEIFPYDNVNIDTELSRLQSAGFIERYEVGEMKVIQVDKFTRHQRISGNEALTKSEYPAPPKAAPECEKEEGSTEENFGSIKEAPEKHQESQEGKGRERKGREGKEEASPSQKFGNQVLMNICDLKEDCLGDQVYFIEHISRQLKILPETIPKWLDDFNDHLKSTAVQLKTVADYRGHFQNWLRIKLAKNAATFKIDSLPTLKKADASKYK